MENKLIDLSIYKKVPKFIAVEGPIGAGKTTLTNLLADSFGYDTFLEQPSANPFLPVLSVFDCSFVAKLRLSYI